MRSEQEVADDVVRMAWRLGCAVIISPTESFPCEGEMVGGYFDCDPVVPVLTVAGKRKDGQWLGILLHEYCHLTQWVEGCDAWRLSEKHSGNFFEWVGGKNIKNIKVSIKASQTVEADNERRTVRLIRELDAPIDVQDYCRRANAYVHFYNVMADKRKWYREPGALYAPEILAECNSTIDKDFSKTPKKLYDAIVKHSL